MNGQRVWRSALLAGFFVAGARLGAQSLPETIEAIDRARVTTRVLVVTAHPDDEPGSVLAYLARGLNADVALLCITRGEGGQNALGPEQGPQLGLLRTEELLAATRTVGAHLFFTRAPDFGYSKTSEETLQVWGDTVLDDMVRVIRTFRPQVVINNWGGVRSGHGNHQAAGILTPRAFAAAADPQAFPQQIREGLKPWRANLLLQFVRGEASRGYRLPLDQISPIWGKSYGEFGREGFVNHRTQGVAAFVGSPFFRRAIFLVTPDDAPFDSKLLAEPLASLGGRFPGLETVLSPGLAEADQSLLAARQAAEALDWAESARALARAGSQIAMLESRLAPQSGDAAADARWELARVREHIDVALADAVTVRLEALADRSEVAAGESFSVRVESSHRASVPGEFAKPSLVLPAGWTVTKEEADSSGAIRFAVTVPAGTKPSVPGWPPDRTLPWPPPLLKSRIRAVVEDYAFEVSAPVMAQHATSTRVDTLPVRLVPAVTLALEPRQFVLVKNRPAKPLELLARVHSYSEHASLDQRQVQEHLPEAAIPAEVTVGLDAPPGWQVSAPQSLRFSGPGDHLVRFTAAPPARTTAGNSTLRAYARRGAASPSPGEVEVFRTSLEPLPTKPTLLWSEPATVAVHVFDVTVPEGLRVGYVAAENDPIPAALGQLGIHVELLDPITLAFNDLRRFDAIAIGIRAYELREDLSRANQRLLDYVADGGTLVVQYQREYVWSNLKPAPYAARVGSPTVRITDENSPVRFLAPDHPVLNFPNKISLEDFRGWIQERGLYFWSQWDARYQPVLGLRDPGEEETAGGLICARVGKGVYIYTGLAFFRQLPEGVSGAYRLFVNLLSQSRAPAK